MSGGREPLRATFWLLDAPDSLAVQSHANPEGYGIATFEPDGAPEVDKRPAAAFADEEFAREAREECSRVYLAHVRYASSGHVALENTHPFEQHGRVFAHNGHFEEKDRLEAELGEYMSLVHGDTDSERFFALVTRAIERAEGDVTAGIASAATWMAENIPLFALNCLLATADGLWALRYPDTHPLFMLERAAQETLDAAGGGRIRVVSEEARRVVLVATERMDDDPGWTELSPGELVHVDADLHVTSRQAVARAPVRRLTLGDLSTRAAASQTG